MDGAGKTTLAKSLAARLTANGIAAIYAYGRTYPVFSRALMVLGRATLLGKFNEKTQYASYNSKKKHTMRNPLLRFGYASAILLDYTLQIWFKLLISFQQDVVVLDRYVYDTIISDISAHFDLSHEQTAKWIRRMFWLAPIPQHTFVIDLPEEVAFARKMDVPDIVYLRDRRAYYRHLPESFPEIILLDGQQTPLMLLDAIYQYVVATDKK
jgi:dTMP kinase